MKKSAGKYSGSKPSAASKELMFDLLNNPDQVNFKVDQLLGSIGRPQEKKRNINE